MIGYLEDTIAAIATAPGEGGIGIVRISGEKAEAILRSVFVPVHIHRQKGGPSFEKQPGSCEKQMFLPDSLAMSTGGLVENRKMTYGYIVEYDEEGTENRIDEVLAVYMKKPTTYTMEDVVEIYCHGSMISLKKTLALVLSNGARLAEPGEFTKRAFLNGRIDLSQAEAVIDLIRARSEKGYEAAMDHLSGRLSHKVKQLRQELTELLVQIEVNIDYPDEDIQILSDQKLKEGLEELREKLFLLKKTMNTGKIFRDGLKTVIAGKPNVGKSSLMNSLLKENRSIVTDIPGTTRDTIEEMFSLRGIYLRIIDTAGIRRTGDVVEQLGVEKSREMYQNADLVLLLLDGSAPLSSEDEELIQELKDKKAIVLINKIDQKRVLFKEDLQKKLPDKKIIEISVQQEIGLDQMEEEICQMVEQGNVRSQEGVVVTNERHGALLEQAIKAIEDGLFSLSMGEVPEIVEIDVRQAWELLGEITGETATDGLIDEIFSRFCLGK